MSDLISRQAAIDALAEELYHNEEDYRTAVKAIGDLPSAQPEVLACGSGELVQESGDLVKELVKDCISRKMAIDGILMFMPVELGKGTSMAEQVNYSAWKTAISCAESYVRTMPSVQPELIEQGAYVRGFEQGRTQGMIDAQGEKDE